MSVKIVGHIDKTAAVTLGYELEGKRVVTFHTAYRDRERTKPVTFFTDLNTWPSVTAARLGIEYYFMRNATSAEAVKCAVQKGLPINRPVVI